MTTRAGPYARLGDYLAAQPAGVDELTLPFAAIEALVGRALPLSARTPRRAWSWWANAGRYPSAWDGWVRVGWRVAAVDLAGEAVTFARRGVGDVAERV